MSANPNPDPTGSPQPPTGLPQQPYYGQNPPQEQPPFYQGQTPPQRQAPPPRHSHRPDFVLPLLLIAVGVLFLLNQFGYNINWAIVWPILLIVLGVGIIFSRGRTPGWVVAILVIVIVAAVVFTVLPNVIPGFPNFLGGSSMQLGELTTNTVRASQTDLGSAKTLRVQMDGSLGSFTLRPDSALGSTAVQLVTTSNIKDLAAPTLVSSGSAYQVSIPGQPWNWLIGWTMNWNNVRLDRDLAINSTLPLDLQLGVTSGKVVLDTSANPIDRLQLKMTSGEVNLNAGTKASLLSPDLVFDFTSGVANASNLGFTNFASLDIGFTSGSGRFALQGLTAGLHRAAVHITSGDIRLLVPQGIGYRVTTHRTSGSIQVDGRSYSDENYESPNYASAVIKLDLDLKVTSGSVSVDLTDAF
jgi:hypothetical protein